MKKLLLAALLLTGCIDYKVECKKRGGDWSARGCVFQVQLLTEDLRVIVPSESRSCAERP